MSYILNSPIISSLPVTVPQGGTGVTSITDHAIIVGSGTAAITVLAAATDGQIPIGSTGADPVIGNITSAGGTVTITNGAGTINLEAAGAVPIQFDCDVGSAVPALGILTIAGGTNLNTSGAVSTVTVNLDAAISGTTSHDFATGGRIGTALLAGNTLLLQAYDVDGAAYTTFVTLTANNTPTMDLDDAVTKAGNYIYRAGGTDVPVADGGTGVSTLTDHGVLVGSGAAAITPLAAATDGQLIIGSTGADPSVAALTGGNNIGVTNAAGSITIDVNGTTQYALQVGDATGSLDSLGIGTANQILQSGGAGANPAWSTATYPATTAQGDILYSSAANTLASLVKDATATRYLANTGASNNPAWDQVNLANGVTGTLPVGNGGSGAATFTDHGVLVGSAAAAFTALAVGTNGQVLLGSTGADPVFATLTSSGGTITFTPGAGSLNLEASGGGMAWVEATGATQAMAVNTGYTTNNGAQLVYTLPATAAVGDICAVAGNSANGWSIAQNAGQTIHFVSSDTTTGVAGSLTSTVRYDCVELVCVTANTDFVVRSSVGNIQVA